MASYWYFVATLPNIQFGQPAPFGSDSFLENARRLLPKEIAGLLASARLLSEAETPSPEAGESLLLGEYRYWERSLRNELARARARRLGRAVEAWVRPAGPSPRPPAGPSSAAGLAGSAATAAQSALAAEDPLSGELLLERERWSLIDRLKTFHNFDLEVLVAYRLQLQILERLALLRPDTGEAGYRAAYADMLSPARSTDMTGVPR